LKRPTHSVGDPEKLARPREAPEKEGKESFQAREKGILRRFGMTVFIQKKWRHARRDFGGKVKEVTKKKNFFIRGWGGGRRVWDCEFGRHVTNPGGGNLYKRVGMRLLQACAAEGNLELRMTHYLRGSAMWRERHSPNWMCEGEKFVRKEGKEKV